MEYKEVLERLKKEAERQRETIERNGDWLWHHPETGYREVKTQEFCLNVLEKYDVKIRTFDGVTGFVCKADSGKPGPVIGLMAEMDSLINFQHPDHDPITGAAHSCGHSVQMATTMGALTILLESGILEELGGKIVLVGVPAEECIEVEWRLEQIKNGKIHYLGGKQELIRRNAFKGIDVMIGIHTGISNDHTFHPAGRHNGFISKKVEFIGKSAHAAGAPELGKNALYMANTALTALNGLRETFKDEDKVRVHPIITAGGEIPNAIPEKVCIECGCRANNIEAEVDAAEKFDRAMIAGAYAFNGHVKIETQPGYLPYIPTAEFDEIAIQTAEEIFGKGYGQPGEDTAGPEDMGDLNCLLPVIQVHINYMNTVQHSSDYRIEDYNIYHDSALFLSALICKMLNHNGELTELVKRKHKPLFVDILSYCRFIDDMFSSEIYPKSNLK